MEQSIIVNENDEIIEYKDRSTIGKDDIYRVSSLLIRNSSGEYLLAQRSFEKKLGPGLWSFSVAGGVEKGESYDDNIIKEIQEEIGILDIQLTKVFKKRMNIIGLNFFCQFYTAKMDVQIEHFTICEKEVAALRWFTVAEIRKGEYEGNKFSENLMRNLESFEAL